MVDNRRLNFRIWPSISVCQYQNLAEQVTAQIRCLRHQYHYTNAEAAVI